jgi:hypothetical protein
VKNRDLRAILFSAIHLVAVSVYGQEATTFEPLSIDRPDQSNLPTTILPGQYQFEIGAERGHGKSLREFHVPSMVFRTGLNRKSELRIGFENLRLDSLANGQINSVFFLMLGGKYRFIEERNARPSVALQAEFALPIGSGYGVHYDREDYDFAAYSFLLLFNNTLHKHIFLNYNAGLFWSRADLLDWLVTASASFLHTGRLGYYVEVYSLILDNKIPVSFDGGLMYLLSPRVQVDIYGGQKAFESERLWFYGAGVGFRLDKGDLKPKTFNEIGIRH